MDRRGQINTGHAADIAKRRQRPEIRQIGAHIG